MNDQDRTLRHLYELQLELLEHQGDEIAALHRANASLQRSHDALRKMLKLTSERLRLN